MTSDPSAPSSPSISVDAPEPEIATLMQALDQVDILRVLPTGIKRRIVGQLGPKVIATGEVVFRQGDPGDAMYIIARGRVAVSLNDNDLGMTVELAQLDAGRPFGEMALITGFPRSATVTALEDCRLLVLERELFLALIQAVPQVGIEIAAVLAERLNNLNQHKGVTFGQLRGRPYDRQLLELVSRDLIDRHRMVPVATEPDGGVLVATPTPHSLGGLEEIRHMLRGCTVRLMAVSADDFDDWVRASAEMPQVRARFRPNTQALRNAVAMKVRQVQYRSLSGGTDDAGRQLVANANPKAVTDLLNNILVEGIERESSDIHIEPDRKGVVVRYRVDGRMVPRDGGLPGNLIHPLISRLKVLAGMDITERRLPQDGRISMRVGDANFDLRVATVTTLHGEKVAIRILDSSRLQDDLASIIAWPPALAAVRRIVYQPSGFVLVTGPSGAGKTTTLYAALLERHAPDLSIATVEDPVEYELPGVTQVPVNEDIGLGFPTIIRTFLRQSPDIIMVGEMRDRATADLTGNAAMTGHMVLTSFHTNDALSAIPRLHDMAVEPYVLSAALVGVVNQRLVRSVCPMCREPATYGDVVQASLKRAGVHLPPDAQLVRGRGCDACNGEGFKGRAGIYEVLEVGPELRDAIAEEANKVRMRAVAVASGGFLSLASYATWMLAAGLTTPTEVLRVLPMGDGRG